MRDAEPFDCLVTPADPDVGVFAEVFRTRSRTRVSDHPEGRFAASGSLADRLLDDVPWDDYYGPGSPLERFVRAGGRVLRLGADLDTVTLLHYAEYLAPLPSKRRVRRHRLVLGRDGPEVRVVECLDDSDGIVDVPGEDYFAVILREYLATGRGIDRHRRPSHQRAHRRGRHRRVRRVMDGRPPRHPIATSSELDALGQRTVDDEVGAGDEAGSWAGDERDGVGHLLGRAHAPGGVEPERGGEQVGVAGLDLDQTPPGK